MLRRCLFPLEGPLEHIAKSMEAHLSTTTSIENEKCALAHAEKDTTTKAKQVLCAKQCFFSFF